MKKGKYYPNPAMKRDKWISLNGSWAFDFDDNDIGRIEHWENSTLSKLIEVPFTFQSKLASLKTQSGKHIDIDGETEYHPILWYKRTFLIDSISKDEEVLINFNAVDYKATVWINGNVVITHEGGYAPFSAAISSYIHKGENIIAVRCEDYHDPAQPRGKQIWTKSHWGCWYTPSSGIWQDVWISFTNKKHLESIMIRPDLDRRMAHFEIEYSKEVSSAEKVSIELYYDNSLVSTSIFNTEEYRQFIHLHILQPNQVDDKHAWSPENPKLYYVTVKLMSSSGTVLDKVETYFGMRKVSTRNGQILLNNRPLYQRLILDQGYWPESLITAPDKESIRKDLELIKALGFNGVRMHQKFEDPWFYYLASEIGLLVWAELPSAYSFSFDEVENVTRDMIAGVRYLYNHPSIITWVPFNESWGIRDVFTDNEEKNFVKGIYYLIKTLDPIRLISGNDGWEQVVTDFSALHDYDIHDSESYMKKWCDKDKLHKQAPSHRQSYAEGCDYKGEPIIITEFGGIALEKDASGDCWGYRNPARNEAELIERLKLVMNAIYSDRDLSGFCYTQLTDVEQEVNGLLYPDRTSKCDIEEFSRIFNPEEK